MASESRQDKVGISSGFCYTTDVSSTHIVNQMQSFESNPELYNLTTGMEMLTTAFPSKNRDGISGSSNLWKGSSGFFNKPTTDYYQTTSATTFSDQNHENLIDHHSSWQTTTTATATDDSSLRYVLNPCEPTHRPSQGLSLSLSNSNHPSTIGLQSFELRGENQEDGFFGKSPNFQQQQHQIMQSSPADHHGFIGIKSGSSSSFLQQNHFHLKNSKYLVPAQELLNEFCNLGTKQGNSHQPKKKPQKVDNSIDDENGGGSSSKSSFLHSLDLLELQKRKAKLLSLLEEVDRRYRQYCDQMKGVVASFETVVGSGGASAYSTLASKAMSKHFRCLRDGIVEQIKATRKAMGEKDIPVAPGTTKGETPRLRVLDQTLRQQRAFQQMSMLESHPWRPQRGLPERSVSVLRAWLFEHFLHPYPSDVDKHILARQTGLSRSQVSNWFINARVRLWKPMVEEMYLEETKEQDNYNATSTTAAASSSSDWITNLEDSSGRPNEQSQHHQHQYLHSEDHKPTHDQLVRGDSESLSSIINIQNDTDHQNIRNHQHFNHHNQGSRQMDQRDHQTSTTHDHGFGIVNLDFSTAYNNDSISQNIGNGVSLTLGLQQHGGNGMSLSFSPASHHQHSLFFPRDQMADCDDDQVQYSILDGEAAQNLPYRNLMGAQLLHDLV